MNNKRDFKIAMESCWYRIPVKSAPTIIKEGTASLIAFYHTQKFEKEKFTIQWFGKIKKISVVKRKELFPKQTDDSKANNDYYKIEFAPLQKMIIPIVSLRPRRILFIPTTEEKFFSAKEINSLFNDSALENEFWNELVRNDIYPERQYFISVKEKSYFLDFAVFCKEKNIDIEVDGDKYHMSEDAVRNDKQRNNLLESKGWSVLRFTEKDIAEQMDRSIDLVMETVNKYGGIQDVQNPHDFYYLKKGEGQIRMFE